jgi:catalase
MAIVNPTTRANYEPNSWEPAVGGPREDPSRGFASFAAHEGGAKRRIRPASFADHYSQARQFYRSQTEPEQRHIAAAFTFELSKCERPEIRERMVAGLRNVDDGLARTVAERLGLERLPRPLPVAAKPTEDLPASPALSILANPPESFAGRKLGILLTDGADATLLSRLRAAAQKEQANVEVIAPRIGGVMTSDGERVPADQTIDGGPSVLYDAVAVVASEDGGAELAGQPAAHDFVSDAFAHCKLVGYTPGALALLEATGLAGKLDDGFVELRSGSAASGFLERCRALRHWERESCLS